MHTLIASYVLLGVGAAMSVALGLAIVDESRQPKERGKTPSMLGSLAAIRLGTGRNYGGCALFLSGSIVV